MPTKSDFLKIASLAITGNTKQSREFLESFAIRQNNLGRYDIYNKIKNLLEKDSVSNFQTSSTISKKQDISKKERKNNVIRIPNKNKADIELFIEFIKKNKKNFSHYNRLLLYGPPGTGKTTLGYYIANEIGEQVNYVKISDIIGSKLGETLKNIDNVFKDPNHKVIFLDEFDVYAKNRSDKNDIGELKRTVNSFIQTLDNPEYNKIIIVSTNVVDEIDPAILRRFKFQIEVGLLDTNDVISYINFENKTKGYINFKKEEIEILGRGTDLCSIDQINTALQLAYIKNTVYGLSEEINFDTLLDIIINKGYINKNSLKRLLKNKPNLSTRLHQLILKNYSISEISKKLDIHRNSFNNLFIT